MMHSWYFGPGFGFAAALAEVLWWALIIMAIVALVRWIRTGDVHAPYHRRDSAVELLRERFAKGEIDKKEFEERMKELQK